MEEKQIGFNPIDKDKVTDTPHLLPYAHHIGSAIIRPIDQSKIKGRAMQAMAEQTQTQLEQIKAQVELLIGQAQKIHERIELAEQIYQADIGFQPVIGNKYYLYERSNGKKLLSLIGPNEWSGIRSMKYLATTKLLSDHTWEVEHKAG